MARAEQNSPPEAGAVAAVPKLKAVVGAAGTEAGAAPNSPPAAGAAAAAPKLKAVEGIAGVTGARDANENKGAAAAGAAEAGEAAAGCVNAPNEHEGGAEIEPNSPPAFPKLKDVVGAGAAGAMAEGTSRAVPKNLPAAGVAAAVPKLISNSLFCPTTFSRVTNVMAKKRKGVGS